MKTSVCLCGDTAGDLPVRVDYGKDQITRPAVHVFASILSASLRRIEGPSGRGEKAFPAEYRKPAYSMSVIQKANHKGLSGSGGVQTYRHDLLCFCASARAGGDAP